MICHQYILKIVCNFTCFFNISNSNRKYSICWSILTFNIDLKQPLIKLVILYWKSRTMAKRCLRRHLWGGPSKMVPSATAGPVPLTIPQWYTHRPGVKCVYANVFPCQAANRSSTSGCPSENCRSWVPTRAPTAPRITTNLIQSIEKAQEASLTLFRVIPPVVFQPDAPTFFPRVLTRGSEWPALPARSNTSNAAPALTETAAPNPTTQAAGRSSKIN